MSFPTNTRLSYLAIALSALLTACGGGGSSSSTPEAPDASANTPDTSAPDTNTPPAETTDQKFWVEGFAVKGAIEIGRASCRERVDVSAGVGGAKEKRTELH